MPTDDNKHRWPIRFGVDTHHKGFSDMRIDERPYEGMWTGCHQLLLVRVNRRPGREADYAMHTFDGGLMTIAATEAFKMMGFVAKKLMNRADAPQDIRCASEQIFDIVRRVVLSHDRNKPTPAKRAAL